MASGGAGQVSSDTSNSAVANGDGIALAEQAGAQQADMEFDQLHPTAFIFRVLRLFYCLKRARRRSVPDQ